MKTKKLWSMLLIFAMVLSLLSAVSPIAFAEESYPVKITENTTVSDKTYDLGGASKEHIFTITGNVTKVIFENVTFKNVVSNGYGGAVYVKTDSDSIEVIFNNCRFVNCKAQYGGAIYTDGSKKTMITLNDTVAEDCKATEQGGFMYLYNDNTYVYGCGTTMVQNCYSTGDGGAIYADRGKDIKGITFIGNSVGEGKSGGAVFIDNDSVHIDDCCFFGNNAANYGGAVYVGSSKSGAITNSVFYNNCSHHDESSKDYALDINGGTVVSGCTFGCDNGSCSASSHIKNSGKVSGCTHESASDGTFTKADNGVYYIKNSCDWMKFCYYVLNAGNSTENDIVVLDADVVAYKPIGLWTGDADTERPFKGTFDGNGHTVTAYMPEAKANNAAFNFTVEADICNLTVCGYVNGTSGAAGVVSHAEWTSITNCRNYAEIHGSDYTGGIVGYATSNTKIINCINYGNVRTSVQRAGGIVGEIHTSGDKVYNCINYGAVKAERETAGGIVGSNNHGELLNCYCDCTVNAPENCGDFCGWESDDATVKECYCEEVSIDKMNANIDNASDVFGEDVNTKNWNRWQDTDGKPGFAFLRILSNPFAERFENGDYRLGTIIMEYNGESTIGEEGNETFCFVNKNQSVEDTYIIGKVNLIISPGVTFDETGIMVARRGNTLLIMSRYAGMDTFTLNAHEGIVGGDRGNSLGTVNIYDGTIIATGGDGKAGIGSGSYYDRLPAYLVDGGTVNVYGGTVTANGGSNAAGIGGGDGGNGCTLNVYGGAVTANGGPDASERQGGSGIGGGCKTGKREGGGGNGGTLNIYGGTVTANGGPQAAGIGGGGYDFSPGQEVNKKGGNGGDVNVYGGVINANSIGEGTRGEDPGTINYYVSECMLQLYWPGGRNIIDARHKLHQNAKTHEKALPVLDPQTGVITPGHIEYYECKCGRFFRTNEGGSLTDEIFDLDAWKATEGKIDMDDVMVTFIDGDSRVEYYLERGKSVPKNGIPKKRDTETEHFLGWFYQNGEETLPFDETVIIDEDMTVNAAWEDKIPVILKDGDKQRTQYVIKGECLPLDALTDITDEEGKITLGWSCAKDGKEDFFNEYTPITESLELTPMRMTEEEIQAYANKIPITSSDKSSLTQLSGIYTVSAGDKLSIDNRCTVAGGAVIFLPDGCDVTFTHGIFLRSGRTLVIIAPKGAEGTGKLTANGGEEDFCAAIGSNNIDNASIDSGTVYILGGTVTATGSGQGAGIGGGGTGSAGTVNISGGTVTAIGGSYAAGIGGGDRNGGGRINISGGTVTAIGGKYAAGIGGRHVCDAGTINISGGTVTATGGDGDNVAVFIGTGSGRYLNGVGGGAGIGSGSYKDGGTINISGGHVTATGGKGGAGIGGGGINLGSYDSLSKGITVNISGGTVIANGGSGGRYDRGSEIGIGAGAGIGGGCLGIGGTITISNGDVTATGGDGSNDIWTLDPILAPCGGAGIGGGGFNTNDDKGRNGGTIVISGGRVTATGKGSGKGIGGSGDNVGGTIDISDGTVRAEGKTALGEVVTLGENMVAYDTTDGEDNPPQTTAYATVKKILIMGNTPKKDSLSLAISGNQFSVTATGKDAGHGVIMVALYDSEKMEELLEIQPFNLADGDIPKGSFTQSGYVQAYWWSALDLANPMNAYCAPANGVYTTKN